MAKRFHSLLTKTLSVMLAALLVAMTMLEIVQVIMRYFAGSGFVWTGDVTVILMQSLAWIGAPALWLMRGHIAVELISGSGKGRASALALVVDAGIVAGGAALLYYGQDALAAFANIDIPSLGTTGDIKYYPMMAGALLLVIAGLLNLATGSRYTSASDQTS
ncbi:TRAP transporter small permease subunit [Hoeflea sp. WL0058]|uniref:TRAP transporter small permease protein n=1 Tax=Flavimaribacter sediminis TaxID=2865987 RepID=A0AAE2ZP37_9HYPH|nr:TRAP transporter small permease subunit [Flavimaribacter sediminis]MBW8637858.1 TRAP transporter small permease subunit [Flavimaribacter sediminis]